MVSHLFFYQLTLIALVWLFIILHHAWPSDRPPAVPNPPFPRLPPDIPPGDPALFHPEALDLSRPRGAVRRLGPGRSGGAVAPRGGARRLRQGGHARGGARKVLSISYSCAFENSCT